MTLFPVIILLALGFILWMRDEMKHSPTKKDDPRPHPLDPLLPDSMPPCPEYDPEYEEALRNAPKLMEEMGFLKGKEIADELRKLPDMSLPPGVSMPDRDYTKDEEFSKKYPFADLNAKAKPLCARCAGLPCKGQRRKTS